MNETNTKSKPLTSARIVHRLPGRIRVRIDRLHDDISYGKDLQQATTVLKGVTEVRINALASSIVITYHPSKLSEQHILDCLGVSLPIVKVARKPGNRTVTDRSDAPPEGDFVGSAEKLTAEITSEAVGESVGEVVGEALGELLMGPVGMAIGAEVGAKIGEEVADAILETRGSANEHLVEESIDSTNEPKSPKPLNPPPKRNNHQKNNQGGK